MRVPLGTRLNSNLLVAAAGETRKLAKGWQIESYAPQLLTHWQKKRQTSVLKDCLFV
jgi:hypothetical protein